MALIQITTTSGAIAAGTKPALTQSLARLVYTAEGFGDSRIAPELTWATFDELPETSMLAGSGTRSAPLYYVRVTLLTHAIDAPAKQRLGAALTRALMDAEGAAFVPDNAQRVWVRFIGVADGDLVVGGNAASLQGLRELVAQAG